MQAGASGCKMNSIVTFTQRILHTAGTLLCAAGGAAATRSDKDAEDPSHDLYNNKVHGMWTPDVHTQQKVSHYVPVLCVRIGKSVLTVWRLKLPEAGGEEVVGISTSDDSQCYTIAVFDEHGSLVQSSSYPFFEEIGIACRFFAATAIKLAKDDARDNQGAGNIMRCV